MKKPLIFVAVLLLLAAAAALAATRVHGASKGGSSSRPTAVPAGYTPAPSKPAQPVKLPAHARTAAIP
ncbi:MAG: hypothetical protein E6G67_10150 [Actinobacteria bacterium]|nr:MAG: hypothetical protein E6G67_10150 [Actinomycetota bacterium]